MTLARHHSGDSRDILDAVREADEQVGSLVGKADRVDDVFKQ